MQPAILLSYDVEEFDMPLEYGGSLSFEEQISYSQAGLEKLLPLLNAFNAKATFYCTGRFAEAKPEIIKQLHDDGHEIASHTYHHSQFELADLEKSKQILENITGAPVHGLRMPRMMPVPAAAVLQAGYAYNSSLNPTWMPGRYKHLDKPRTAFIENGMLQFPASVSPQWRVPLFWLSLHNFPLWLYWHFCKKTVATDGYANLYFHPWEFTDYRQAGGTEMPGYVTRNCGVPMLQRTTSLLQLAKGNGCRFITTYDWLKESGKLLA